MDPQLLGKALTTESCLDWLGICHAECCKCVLINADIKLRCENTVHVNFGPDRARYHNFHPGEKYGHGKLHIKFNKGIKIKDGVLIASRCNKLTPELLCQIHNTKPGLCKNLCADKKSQNGVFLTPNCLFTYKAFLNNDLYIKFGDEVLKFFEELKEE